jgi:hypothetical protein
MILNTCLRERLLQKSCGTLPSASRIEVALVKSMYPCNSVYRCDSDGTSSSTEFVHGMLSLVQLAKVKMFFWMVLDECHPYKRRVVQLSL